MAVVSYTALHVFYTWYMPCDTWGWKKSHLLYSFYQVFTSCCDPWQYRKCSVQNHLWCMMWTLGRNGTVVADSQSDGVLECKRLGCEIQWQGGPKNLKTTQGRFFSLRPLLPPPLLPSKQGMFSSKNGMFFPPFFWRNFQLQSWWAVYLFQLSNGSKIFKYTTCYYN